MQTHLHTSDAQLNALYPAIRAFLEQDQADYVIDGERVHGYRSPDCPAIWIRDHSDIIRGARYFDADLTSATTHFAHTQRFNGSLFDFVTCDMDPENWTKYVRVPVEADVEYRFVKALYLGWQASGDGTWLAAMLPHADRALQYVMTHPWRWSEEHGLVKRALTMDTWDFDFVSQDQPWLNFRISDQTHWGLFHGDNSGYFEALELLARMHQEAGSAERAGECREQAEGLRQRANELCWNGRFYRHRVPLDEFRIAGVDEEQQLTLSNPMAINRGLADHHQAVAMLDEYERRGQQSGAFAPWFSVDPPYPDGCFGDPKLVGGAYINGGIFPLVGGELARAAFEHGRESLGVETLRRYAKLIAASGATYLWYFPDGSPSSVETSTSPEATATDGWGSSAMLFAFIEGLAGVTDQASQFRSVRLAPRWPAAAVDAADVTVAYGSGAGLRYVYQCQGDSIQLQLEAAAAVDLHAMLPAGALVRQVRLNGEPLNHRTTQVQNSKYVDARFHADGSARITIELASSAS
jgi:hypothetical protein